MGKSSSIIPGLTVPAVTIGQVRYALAPNGLVAGFDQMGEYLAAYVEKSDQKLWTLKVYDNHRRSEKEGDAQDVFFKSMTAQPDETLLIETERGYRFVVGPANRTSRPVAAAHGQFWWDTTEAAASTNMVVIDSVNSESKFVRH